MSSLLQLIDRPIAFQRSFVRLGVGVTGALLLSQMIYWHNRTDGQWFYKTQAELEEETGLSRYEQESARKKLHAIGVLEEVKKGIPAKLYYRVNSEVLQALLLADNPPVKPRNQGCGNPATCDVEIPQAGMGYFPKPVRGNPASIHTVDYTETTTEITTEITNLQEPKKPALPAKQKRDKTPLQIACQATWSAYKAAYIGRYGAAPLQNLKINSQIKQFVQRVGMETAPRVAEFYLAVNTAFYVQKLHPVGNLLADAESLHTQWATGTTMTHTRARQIDKTQSNFSAGEEAVAMLRAKREQEARNANG